MTEGEASLKEQERSARRLHDAGMLNDALPTLSVIVPVYNGGVEFRLCLTGLAQAKLPESELIVVADGESDGAWRVASDYGARVICLPEQSGPAVARNQGAKEARGDIVLFIDADVVVRPETCRQIVAAFAADPDLVAVIGSYDDAPAATNFLSQYKNLFHHYVHQHAHEQASTFWGACGAVRRNAFLALGGFNEHYRQPSIEDIEFGYRLTRTGAKVRLLKTLQVTHLKQWDMLSLLKTDFLYRALPWTALILHSRRAPNDLNLSLASRVSTALVYGVIAMLMASSVYPMLLLAAGGGALALFLLNLSVYYFFWRKRGWWFAVRTVPFHWLYYGYSGLAFAYGVATFLARRSFLSPASSATTTKEASSTGQFFD